MHNIYDCVDSFEKLLNVEYEIVIGRKGKAVTLHVYFDNIIILLTDTFVVHL